MDGQVLSDIRVIDLTHYVAGPYCTKLLADFGADVIKVERPGTGDPARRLGPFPGDEPHPEKSGLFLFLNTNKRSITLNLKSETGRKILLDLVKTADILVENFSPRVMPSLGLSYDDLRKVNPRLVMTSISNFGQDGPYRDFKASDLVLYAMGGAMSSTGLPEREPIRMPGNIIQYQAGTVAAAATMGAFLVARYQGVGQHVDVSIFETQLGSSDRRTTFLLGYQYHGLPAVREQPTGTPVGGIYPCADGYVAFLSVPSMLPRFLEMIGRPELVTDPHFASPAALLSPETKEFIHELLLPWLLERTRYEVMAAAQRARFPGMVVLSPGDLVNDPHFNERGFWVEISHPVAGTFKYPGPPLRMSEGGWQVRRPAPLLGEHNDEIYCGELGYSRDDLDMLRERGVI